MIGSDLNRFKNIVRNKVKHNLGKFISSEKLISQKNGKKFSIPLDSIDVPVFSYGSNNGGTGSGEGDDGDPIFGNEKKKSKGKGAGEEGADKEFGAEFSPEELAELIGEELNLPNIENKSKGETSSIKGKYNSISNNGTEGLKHFKRTYKEALKRDISTGIYNPKDPKIIPIKADKRYKSYSTTNEPNTNTAIIYIIDCSGSMSEEHRYIAKAETFWINLWLNHQYKGIETRFLAHSTECSEVSEEEFFTVSESGGTMISSAYEMCAQIIEEDYNFADWNTYIIHFSDSGNVAYDNEKAALLLRDKLIPNCNLFCYGQVLEKDGDFLDILAANFSTNEKVALSEIKNRDGILNSIKEFLGKGK